MPSSSLSPARPPARNERRLTTGDGRPAAKPSAPMATKGTTVCWQEGSLGFASGDWSGLLRLYHGWAPVPEIMAALALLHPEFRQHESQQALYERVLLAPLVVRFAPPTAYTRRLAMALVKECASENVELFEPLLELAWAPCSSTASKQHMGYRVYQFASERCQPDRTAAIFVVLHCADEALAPDDVSIATSVWPAGRWLAQYLVSRPQLMRGRRVVELGCGCGTVGIAVAKGCGPATMLLTDNQPDAVANARHNLSANGLDEPGAASATISNAEQLDWAELGSWGGGVARSEKEQSFGGIAERSPVSDGQTDKEHRTTP